MTKEDVQKLSIDDILKRIQEYHNRINESEIPPTDIYWDLKNEYQKRIRAGEKHA